MLTEIITKDRLKRYYAAACYLIKLGRELEEICQELNFSQGIQQKVGMFGVMKLKRILNYDTRDE